MRKPICITILIASFGLIFHATPGLSQKGPNRYFAEPMLVDSLTTFFMPTRYNEDFLSANKIAFWGDYYANIVVYNYKTDSYKKLFEQDTFIEPFRPTSAYAPANERIRNLTKNSVFLLVKTKDTNGSGRIDEKDPTVLFAVSPNGENLKQLTYETEHVVSFDLYEKLGFILVKIQKVSDGDRSFKNEDREYCYKKISLTDLTVGKAIELK